MRIEAVTIEKAKALVQQMTLEEKVHFCTGDTYWTTFALERLGIDGCIMSDGPHGVRKVKEKDHLGQAVNERATGFPVSVAMGATWNKELLKEMGRIIGRECQAIGVDILLGPAVNMKRSVLGGRDFEYISEDPVLAGKLAAEIVKGIQSTGTGACIKHFACNNSESHRMTLDVNVDERTLRELYLKVFEIIVKEANPMAVMGSYNKVNGDYACENKKLLTEILREEWGFEGLVLSDWLAVEDCVKAVKAGLNLEMPSNPAVYRRLVEAVKNGQLPIEVLDQRVEELLSVLFTLQGKRNPEPVDWKGHQKTACRVATESMVLLRNKNHLLPFDWKETKSLAVIGDFAVHPRNHGGGSSKVETEGEDNILTWLTGLSKGKFTVQYAKGYESDGSTRDELLAQAKETAAACDQVVIFAGLPESYESEGYDRQHMKMPEGHLQMIEEISKIRRDVLVVLSNGSAIELPFLEHVDGVLETWLLGQEASEAIARVILGLEQPSGRMPDTFPYCLKDDPAGFLFDVDEGKLIYGERMMTGYRYFEKRNICPAIPFGYGLSYTEFTYSGLELSRDSMSDQEVLSVSVNVKNTGDCAGYEVVQLYVSNRQKIRLHPEKELKDFEKIYLESGEEKKVTFSLAGEVFQCYSEEAGRWLTEDGSYEILIGASSQDIRCQKELTVTSSHHWIPELTMTSTLEQWLAHPQGKEEAEKMLESYRGFGMGNGRKFSDLSYFVQQIMLEMPMPRLITASVGSFTEEELKSMLASIKGKEKGK